MMQNKNFQQRISVTKKIEKNTVSENTQTTNRKSQKITVTVMNQSTGLQKTPKKSILKKSRTKEIDEIYQKQNQERIKQNMEQKKNTLQKQVSKLTWDEEAIEEHDKQRGKTMRIDEPKTPYECDKVGSDEEERQEMQQYIENNPNFEGTIEDVQEQLQIAKQNQQLNQKSQKLDLNEINKRLQEDLNQNRELLLDSDEERENEAEKERKKKAFELKRKLHYNEAQEMKALKEQMRKQMEEEDDEDDEEEEM